MTLVKDFRVEYFKYLLYFMPKMTEGGTGVLWVRPKMCHNSLEKPLMFTVTCSAVKGGGQVHQDFTQAEET